jgi:hypothetical protein
MRVGAERFAQPQRGAKANAADAGYCGSRASSRRNGSGIGGSFIVLPLHTVHTSSVEFDATTCSIHAT